MTDHVLQTIVDYSNALGVAVKIAVSNDPAVEQTVDELVNECNGNDALLDELCEQLVVAAKGFAITYMMRNRGGIHE